mmetsp:Transcript_201/g.353  ORF Transcript_201/g.353 Transcript_201/m.353 type:complete len:926 (-) Transcript_201:159-2936(-)
MIGAKSIHTQRMVQSTPSQHASGSGTGKSRHYFNDNSHQARGSRNDNRHSSEDYLDDKNDEDDDLDIDDLDHNSIATDSGSESESEGGIQDKYHTVRRSSLPRIAESSQATDNSSRAGRSSGRSGMSNISGTEGTSSMRSSTGRDSARSLATESASSWEFEGEEDIETAIMEEMGMEKERDEFGVKRGTTSDRRHDTYGRNNSGKEALNGNVRQGKINLNPNGSGGFPLRSGGFNYNHLSASSSSKINALPSMMKNIDLNGISTKKVSELAPTTRETLRPTASQIARNDEHDRYGDDDAEESNKKTTTKLVSIRILDPGDPAGRPTTVTVAMKVPTKKERLGSRGRNIFERQLANHSLGAGQKVFLRLREKVSDDSQQQEQQQTPQNKYRPLRNRQQLQQQAIVEFWQPPDESDDKTSNSNFMQSFRIPEQDEFPEPEIHCTDRENQDLDDHDHPQQPPITTTTFFKKRNSGSTMISEITTDNTTLFGSAHHQNSGRITFGNPNPHNFKRSSDFNTSEIRNNNRNSDVHNDNQNISFSHNQSPNKTTSTSNNDSKPTKLEQPPPKPLDPFTIPTILSTTIIKQTPNQKVGLAFRKSTTGNVIIEKIMPGSVFDGTAMKAGHECLIINGHRVRSARKAAEIVRESEKKLTLVVSSAVRPPGTMYTIISIGGGGTSNADRRKRGDDTRGDHPIAYAAGMHFKMKQGLVQLVKIDSDSPLAGASMKVGDFVLAVNGSAVATISDAVRLLSKSENQEEDLIPILYFNMRQLRVSLVDKVIGDLWKKDWSEAYDECVVLEPGASSKPLTFKFNEEGRCELLDPLRAFRVSGEPLIPVDHPLNSVMDTLNHGIICVLAAIRQGLELATGGGEEEGVRAEAERDQSRNATENGPNRSVTKSLKGNLDQLSKLYNEGMLNKDDFEAIKTRLLS